LTNVSSQNKEYFNVVNEKVLNNKTGPFSGIIEKEFLKKLIKDQTKQDKKIEIGKADAWCLVIDDNQQNKKIKKYIEWGERQG
jgi:hypothetical protein